MYAKVTAGGFLVRSPLIGPITGTRYLEMLLFGIIQSPRKAVEIVDMLIFLWSRKSEDFWNTMSQNPLSLGMVLYFMMIVWYKIKLEDNGSLVKINSALCLKIKHVSSKCSYLILFLK